MNKKEYKQPLMKVIELDSTDILAESNEPKSFRLFDEEVDRQDEATQRGYQW